jgi:TPR repeat protein
MRRLRFLFAAEHEDSQARYNLGQMYFDEGDLREAERWLSQSTDPRAAELLSRIRG